MYENIYYSNYKTQTSTHDPVSLSLYWLAVSADWFPSWSVVNLSEISSGRKWWGEGEQEIKFSLLLPDKILCSRAPHRVLMCPKPLQDFTDSSDYISSVCVRVCAPVQCLLRGIHDIHVMNLFKLAAVESIFCFPQDWTLKASLTHAVCQWSWMKQKNQ